ncbi:MAG: hypothetical protein Q8R67_05125 [Rhodoferax sp.]|nr:hypothetical protein [Rhodoferax sp.]MDP3651048.1 hypothetical protein [Rhodoferax sp.]
MFTLAIDNVVEVPVKFTLKAGKVNKPFAVTLLANRKTAEESEAEASGLTISEFMLDNVTGWHGQTLVLGEDGKPAEFSREALQAMFRVGNVLALCWAAYLRECGAKEKN